MIHYHGTPITPRTQLERMAGRHFCVSFLAPQNLKFCLSRGASVMLDNGAFSAFTRGAKPDFEAFYRWLEPVLIPPHWAVIPDQIGGDEDAQRQLLARWPAQTFGFANAAAVWHLDKPFSYLHFLISKTPKVCLGSSGEFWQVGSDRWKARVDETFNELARVYGVMPWIHGLRMLAFSGARWPIASADSVNVGRNFKQASGCAECMARRIDEANPAGRWKSRTPHYPADLFALKKRGAK